MYFNKCPVNLIKLSNQSMSVNSDNSLSGKHFPIPYPISGSLTDIVKTQPDY